MSKLVKCKKPMELKFSDLNEDEKNKYLQFLINNNIFFEEEKENNNYTATIKFTQQINENSRKTKKNSSQPIQFNDAFTMAGTFSRNTTFHLKKEKFRKELKEIQNAYGNLFFLKKKTYKIKLSYLHI